MGTVTTNTLRVNATFHENGTCSYTVLDGSVVISRDCVGKCQAKHTPYQPTPQELRCPKCGAKCPTFYIDESAAGANEACTKDHDDDEWRCMGTTEDGYCNYVTTGRALTARIAKAKNLVPGPHCKGSGVVAGKRGG